MLYLLKKEIKSELKDLVKRIRENKIALKAFQRENGGSQGMIGYALKKLQREFRHKHIAYCLMRGRTIEQIERGGNKENNGPDMYYVKSIVAEYTKREESFAASNKEVINA